ncbi:hypothetical protein TNCV_2311131 [Trichonephila clavipes]|nr:hypothetical protein TNCV_2311131 [Trichonephila clavipes]
MKILIQFSTTYLCEKAFSSVPAIKTRYRSHLEINAVLLLAIIILDPNIHNLTSKPNVHNTYSKAMGTNEKGLGIHETADGIRIGVAATPDQLWQRVKAAWSAVPQEHIQSLFELMPRRVEAVFSNNGTPTLATNSGRNHTSQKSINLII